MHAKRVFAMNLISFLLSRAKQPVKDWPEQWLKAVSLLLLDCCCSFNQKTIVAVADDDADVADFFAGAAVAFVGIVAVIYLSDCCCTLCKRPFVCAVRQSTVEFTIPMLAA